MFIHKSHINKYNFVKQIAMGLKQEHKKFYL